MRRGGATPNAPLHGRRNTTKACDKTQPRTGSVIQQTPAKAQNRTPPHLTRNEEPEADL